MAVINYHLNVSLGYATYDAMKLTKNVSEPNLHFAKHLAEKYSSLRLCPGNRADLTTSQIVLLQSP